MILPSTEFHHLKHFPGASSPLVGAKPPLQPQHGPHQILSIGNEGFRTRYNNTLVDTIGITNNRLNDIQSFMIKMGTSYADRICLPNIIVGDNLKPLSPSGFEFLPRVMTVDEFNNLDPYAFQSSPITIFLYLGMFNAFSDSYANWMTSHPYGKYFNYAIFYGLLNAVGGCPPLTAEEFIKILNYEPVKNYFERPDFHLNLFRIRCRNIIRDTLSNFIKSGCVTINQKEIDPCLSHVIPVVEWLLPYNKNGNSFDFLIDPVKFCKIMSWIYGKED